MKNAFTLLFIVITFNSYAQVWSPFNLSEKFNYQSDTANIITASYFTDSVKVIGTDSVFYLNRIVVQYANNVYDTALINQPQFWEREMVKKQNGNYQFRNQGNKSLLTFAASNDSWLFDSIQNISATVISIHEENIFSNPDTVKTILLSSGDTIKLSKHFGFTKFPLNDSSAIFQNLVGINGRNIGELIPDFNSVFDFDVDDVFSFSFHANGWFSSGDDGYTTEKILTKNIISSDSIEYTVQVHTYIYPFGAPNSYTSNHISTWKFGTSKHGWMNRFAPQSIYNSLGLYTYQYHDYSIPLGGIIYDMRLDSGACNRKSITTKYSGYYDSLNGDTLFQFNTFEPPTVGFTYTEGLGLTNINSVGFENSGNNYVARNFNLTGYIKGTEVCGVILGEQSILEYPAFIYPTLCTDKIYIQNIFSQSTVSILDIFGRLKIKSEIFKDSNIDMSPFPSGIYFVHIENNSTVFSQKIIKQ